MFLGKMHLISGKTCRLYMKFAFYFSLYRLALHLLKLHLLIIVLHLLKDCLIRKENSAHFSYHNLVYNFWCLKYHMTWMNACPCIALFSVKTFQLAFNLLLQGKQQTSTVMIIWLQLFPASPVKLKAGKKNLHKTEVTCGWHQSIVLCIWLHTLNGCLI